MLSFIVAMSALLLPLWWRKPLDAHGSIRLDLNYLPESLDATTHNPPTIGVKGYFLREKTINRQFKAIFRLEVPKVKPEDTLVVCASSGFLVGSLAIFLPTT